MYKWQVIHFLVLRSIIKMRVWRPSVLFVLFPISFCNFGSPETRTETRTICSVETLGSF